MTQKKFLYFVHIERAGGTTLQNLIRHVFPTYLSLRPWWCWANEPENAISAEELAGLVRWLPWLSGVGGHTTRSWMDCETATGQRVMRFTFLRDPVARYMSHFNYQRVRMGLSWQIDQFLDEGRFANYQTKRLAGRFDLDVAKQALDEAFDFVGLTERFDESLLLWRHELGLPDISVHYERRNALPKDQIIHFQELTGSQRDRISDANRLDIDLYTYAKEEIFPRFVDRYPGDLPTDLKQFRETNQDYHYSSLRSRLWSPWLRVAKTIIEPVLHARHDRPQPAQW